MKRASGTFWGRQLGGNGWLIGFFAVWIGWSTGEWLGTLIVLIFFPGSILILGDLWTYTRFDLRPVYCGTTLRIGEGTFHPDQIISLRELKLSAPKNSWYFVEIHYNAGTVTARALCPSRTVWPWGKENPTIRIILEHFPSLKEKVLPDYDAYGYKEVRDPATRDPDPPPPVYAEPSPTARYRDPYFQRRRR